IFNSRKARLTYGNEVWAPMDEDDPDYRQRCDAGEMIVDESGVTRIKGVFRVHVTIGDDIPANGVLMHKAFHPLTLAQTINSIEIFASHSRNPKFVNEDGCFRVGDVSFAVDMTQKTIQDRAYRVELRFGGPELTVKILHRTKDEEIADGVMTLSRPP
ncbi:unnamed protein product, partial [Hapterophycus canaliculatus]